MPNTLFKIISTYNIEAKVHTVCPDIAKVLGVDCSLLLNQVYYWITLCGKKIEKIHGSWIYNSLEEWHKQFPYWSLSKLRRIIKSLEDSGLIISTKVNSKKWNQTKWYTVNVDALKKLLGSRDSKEHNMTDRFVQNEQMILKKTKNNYKTRSSYIEENLNIENTKEKDLKKAPCVIPDLKTPTLYQNHIIEHYNHTNTSIPGQVQQRAKDMVTVWNEEFKYSLKPVKAFSNKKTEKILCDLYQNHFSSNMEEWRKYALKVNSSKFLMGEKETKIGFKAVFQWLIKPEVVDAILGGAYGVGDRELDKNNLVQNIAKQKDEIIKQTNIKISEYVTKNVSEAEEIADFNEYVLNKKFEKDGDIYKIADQVTNNTWLSPKSLVYDAKNKEIYQLMYESYIMKKYLGKTRLEAKAEIKLSIDNLEQKNTPISLFEKLKSIKNTIDRSSIRTSSANLFSIIDIDNEQNPCNIY